MGADGAVRLRPTPACQEEVLTQAQRRTAAQADSRGAVCCSLSRLPLSSEAIVFDKYGHVFIQRKLEEYLDAISRGAPMRPGMAHISSMKKVKQLRFNSVASGVSEGALEVFLCPVRRVAWSPTEPFAACWPCGHAFSLPVASSGSRCPICGEPSKGLVRLIGHLD